MLNTRRPLFADARMRRAVAYALDRRTLAAALGAAPTSHVLPPNLLGFGDGPGYSLSSDLRTARALVGGRHGRAVFAVGADAAGVVYDAAGVVYDAALVQRVRDQLAAIGIEVTVLRCSKAPATRHPTGLRCWRALTSRR